MSGILRIILNVGLKEYFFWRILGEKWVLYSFLWNGGKSVLDVIKVLEWDRVWVCFICVFERGYNFEEYENWLYIDF